MGKTYNGQPLSLGFEFRTTKPADDREVIETAGDRLKTSTWLCDDGNYYVYPGMRTTCKDSGQIFVYIGGANNPEHITQTRYWIEAGTESATLILYSEFQQLTPKRLRYYYVARDQRGLNANRIWRVYLKNKPIFEFDDQENISSVFPIVFPLVFTSTK